MWRILWNISIHYRSFIRFRKQKYSIRRFFSVHSFFQLFLQKNTIFCEIFPSNGILYDRFFKRYFSNPERDKRLEIKYYILYIDMWWTFNGFKLEITDKKEFKFVREYMYMCWYDGLLSNIISTADRLQKTCQHNNVRINEISHFTEQTLKTFTFFVLVDTAFWRYCKFVLHGSRTRIIVTLYVSLIVSLVQIQKYNNI